MKITTKKIAFAAIFAAMAYVLDYFSPSISNVIKITIYALPLVMCSILLGPGVGVLAGFVEGLVAQLTSKWGITITAPLWMIAPILWGLLPGLFIKIFNKKERNYLSICLSIILTAFLITFVNTLVIYLDAIIMEYPTELAWAIMFSRIGLSLASASVYCIVTCLTYKPLSTFFKSKKEPN